MIRKIALFITLALASTIGAWSQSNANNFIDNVVSQMQKSKGITADFTMRGSDRSGIYMQGRLQMQGKKFYLETSDMTTWYDGKTMWSYAESIGEVNVTEPTTQELAEINPYLMLDTYRHSFNVEEIVSPHKGERIFSLTPTKRNTNFSRIVVTIATGNMAPIAFEITDRNNNTTLVAVTNYDSNTNLPATTFTYDPHKYPQASIIDLR